MNYNNKYNLSIDYYQTFLDDALEPLDTNCCKGNPITLIHSDGGTSEAGDFI